MNKPHGIMFHHFHDKQNHPKGQGSISKEQFRSLILWLMENYNILSAKEWYEKSKNQLLDHKDICITFDDNLLCQYEIALPVLEEFNIQAFWFVYSSPLIGIKEKLEIYRYFRFDQFDSINKFYSSFNDFIHQSDIHQEVEEKLKLLDTNKFLSGFPFYTYEDKVFRYVRDHILGQERYYSVMDAMIEKSDMDINYISQKLWNSKENIKYLYDSGHVIGLHSHTHPTEIQMMPSVKQREEYEENMKILTSIIGNNVFSVSHPCNSYNDETLKILNKMDISFGFRANMEDGFSSTLEYPRIDHTLLMDKIKEK